MIAEERRAILIKELNETGYIQATELAHKLDLSAATIRRDLEILQKEGLCHRKRGGAVRSYQGVSHELPYIVKQNQNIREKKRIAAAAIELIADGTTLILDAGSTTYELALLLHARQQITVVTNDLKIAVHLASNPNINLICTGGIVRHNVFTLQGSQVEAMIRNLKVDQTFLGADAIHQDGIISNVNFDEVPIKQAMLNAANSVFVLADSSKFSKTGFVNVCRPSEIDYLITDVDADISIIDVYKAEGTEVITV